MKNRILLVLGLCVLCGCGQPGPREARPAPEVKLKLLQAPGERLEGWSSLRGKLVVLDFWATWCDSCLESLPHLNALTEQFKGRPVQFISVSNDEEGVVRSYLKKNRMAGWVGIDEDGSAFEAFRVRGLPYIVILDAEGRVLGETYPDQLTVERLEAMLQAQQPKTKG